MGAALTVMVLDVWTSHNTMFANDGELILMMMLRQSHKQIAWSRISAIASTRMKRRIPLRNIVPMLNSVSLGL